MRAFADISKEALPKRGIGVMFDSVVFVKTINIINCVQEGNIFGGSGIGVKPRRSLVRVLIHLQSRLAITCSGLPVPITWELLVPIVEFGRVDAGWDCGNWGRCLGAV